MKRFVPFLFCAAIMGNPLPMTTHPIMRNISPTWYRVHFTMKKALPKYPQAVFPVHRTARDVVGVNLLPFINFAACEGVNGWNQGQCGCCWNFGSTAACSILYGVQEKAPQLFSTQWFNSDYYATTGQTACDGGDTNVFANWYAVHPCFIPWTNENASFRDGNGGNPSIAASAIGTSPNVPFTSFVDQEIITQGVTQAQAIANIKAVLNNNQPVILSYFLPGAGWDNFDNFWDSASEKTPWSSIDAFNGQTFDANGGGHIVCIVGYDNTNNSWIALNSWGTTTGRPDGYFEIPQNMGYSDTLQYAGSMYQFEFDTFAISGWKIANPTPAPANKITCAITSPTTAQTIASGYSVVFAATATDSNPTAPLNYSWNFEDGNTAIGTTPTHTFVNKGQFPITYLVTLTVTDGTGATAQATRYITVKPASPYPQVSVVITPQTKKLYPHAKFQFQVLVTGNNPGVVWRAGKGYITRNGLYTAPGLCGTYTVSATSLTSPFCSGSATVIVTKTPGE